MSREEDNRIEDTGSGTYSPIEAEMYLDIDAIVADYRRRQRVEHMLGPLISLVVHVIVIASALIFFRPTVVAIAPEQEVQMEELRLRELDPEILEDQMKLEQLAADVVPTVEKPDVPRENVEISTDDFNDEMAETDDSLDFSNVLDVKQADTPLRISSLYGGRGNKGRKDRLAATGGSLATEDAVLKALRWLKKTQNPDGSWSRTQPAAMGGLGLLTFLAHGETPESEEFGLTVQRAMKYLADCMMAVPDTQEKGLERAYTNGIATYALAEAYGLTKVPFLKPPMEKGLGFILDGQQLNGGFDYNYKKEARWDLSVTGWQAQAMKACLVAGSENEKLLDGIEKTIAFMKDVSYRDGKFGYSKPGEGSPGIQGAGTLCLQLLGEGSSKEARAGVRLISGSYAPVWDDEAAYSGHTTPVYNWYYQNQAMFHDGGTTWKGWNRDFSPMVVRKQKNDGHWDSPGKWEKEEYDPWYATTLCCLSLQVYYRYLPTYKAPTKVARPAASILNALDDGLGLEFN